MALTNLFKSIKEKVVSIFAPKKIKDDTHQKKTSNTKNKNSSDKKKSHKKFDKANSHVNASKGKQNKLGEKKKNFDKSKKQKKSHQNNEASVVKSSEIFIADYDKIYPIPNVDDKWDASQYVVEPEEGKKLFTEFSLPAPILHAISDLGFKYCTPIQAATLGETMAGRNVAGKAQTGTGKTAAFIIAILKRMLDAPEKRAVKIARPSALVIAPTRELVMQIAKDAEALGKYCGLRCVAVYGGMGHKQQQDALLSQPVDIIAATPGRLLDFKRMNVIKFDDVQTLVIDEADRMLDMGFIPDVRRIIRGLPSQDTRQTLLFSATLNDEVMRLASQWMPNPIEVSVDPEHGTVDTIKQVVYPIASKEKFTVLYNILKSGKYGRVIIFRNRKRDCEDLARQLTMHGFDVALLSGDVEQKKRCRILEEFRSGKIKLVVATDVAGRGIHIDDISLVVNYDFPYEADDYIHRIGRTGRAGTQGTACSFACEDESFIIPEIEELLGETLHCQQPDESYFNEVPPPVRKNFKKHHNKKKVEVKVEQDSSCTSQEPSSVSNGDAKEVAENLENKNQTN